jgi:DNA replication protein DnaC
MDQQQQFDLLEVIEDRHGKYSAIIASQIPPVSWFDVSSESTVADALLDRLVHTSHHIELKGETLRKNSTFIRRYLLYGIEPYRGAISPFLGSVSPFFPPGR